MFVIFNVILNYLYNLGPDISFVPNRFQVWSLYLSMLSVANLLFPSLSLNLNFNQALHFRRIQDPSSIQQRCQVTHRHSWVHQFFPCEDQ